MSDTFFVENGEVLEIMSTKTAKGSTMYRMKVYDPGEDSEDVFGLGFDKPEFGEKAVISFDAEESGKYLNALVDSIEIHDEGDKPKGRGGRGSSSNRGSSGRGGSRGSNQSSGGRSSRNDDGGSSRSSRGGGSKSSSGNGRGSKGAGGKDSGGTNWAEKDKRIELMSARNSAIELVKVALENKALSLGSKADLKLELLEEFVNEQTARFLEQNETFIANGVEAVYADAGDGGDGEEE